MSTYFLIIFLFVLYYCIFFYGTDFSIFSIPKKILSFFHKFEVYPFLLRFLIKYERFKEYVTQSFYPFLDLKCISYQKNIIIGVNVTIVAVFFGYIRYIEFFSKSPVYFVPFNFLVFLLFSFFILFLVFSVFGAIYLRELPIGEFCYLFWRTLRQMLFFIIFLKFCIFFYTFWYWCEDFLHTYEEFKKFRDK